ncbi:MAG: hypothetical protein ACLP01_14080 [Solirubrobacteraceae bacterium]
MMEVYAVRGTVPPSAEVQASIDQRLSRVMSIEPRSACSRLIEVGGDLRPRLNNLIASHGPDEITILGSLMAGRPAAMATLILGAIVRYVGTTEATVSGGDGRPM